MVPVVDGGVGSFIMHLRKKGRKYSVTGLISPAASPNFTCILVYVGTIGFLLPERRRCYCIYIQETARADLIVFDGVYWSTYVLRRRTIGDPRICM